MKRTFENYLIMVGIRSDEYTYTDDQLFDNTEYFKKCYNDNLSAYKALLFLHDHLQEVEARGEQSINYDGVLAVVDCDHDWQAVFHHTHHVCDYCPDCDTVREL